MTTVVVRQSGGAEIISIPKAIGKVLGLRIGSELDLSIVDNRLVLDPIVERTSLEDLLADSPRENFRILDEDLEWLNTKSAGREV